MRAMHPGEVLRMDFAGFDIFELAKLLEIFPGHLQDILDGRLPITKQIAENIVAAFGGDVESWMDLQRDYDKSVGGE